MIALAPDKIKTNFLTSRSNEDVVGEVRRPGPVPRPHPDGILGLGLQPGDDRLVVLHVLDAPNPQDPGVVQGIVHL